MKLFKIAVRNVKRNKKRSILSLIATAIATFAIVFMFSLIEGMELDMKNLAYNYETGEVLIRNKKIDEKVFSLNRVVDNYNNVISIVQKDYPYLDISPRLRFPCKVATPHRGSNCALGEHALPPTKKRAG